MFRLIAALLASFALSVPSAIAAGSKFTDQQGRFNVNVPTNWVANVPEGGQPAVILVGAIEQKKLLGVCVIIVQEAPDTRSASQAEIDAELAQTVDEPFWKAAIESSGAKDVIVESFGTRKKAGRSVYQVQATWAPQNATDGTRVKGKQEVHPTPGRMHFVVCITEPALYQTASADFDAIFQSYEPRSGLISQAPSTGTSVVTAYSGTNYEGQARVFGQNTANLSALGLGGPAGSVTISGAGQWEVCEGVNFTGNCHVLSANETAASGQILMIGSARRHAAPNKGALGTAASEAFSAATARLSNK
jgi:Beta/Gamma crystallin